MLISMPRRLEGEGHLGIAPAELLHEGIEEGGEAEESECTRDDAEDEAGKDNPTIRKKSCSVPGKAGMAMHQS